MPGGGPYSNMDDASSPADDWIGITPSDTVKLQPKPKALYFNDDGVVMLESAKGNIEDFNVTAGQVLPCRPLRVRDTDTTVTSIKALY